MTRTASTRILSIAAALLCAGLTLGASIAPAVAPASHLVA